MIQQYPATSSWTLLGAFQQDLCHLELSDSKHHLVPVDHQPSHISHPRWNLFDSQPTGFSGLGKPTEGQWHDFQQNKQKPIWAKQRVPLKLAWELKHKLKNMWISHVLFHQQHVCTWNIDGSMVSNHRVAVLWTYQRSPSMVYWKIPR